MWFKVDSFGVHAFFLRNMPLSLPNLGDCNMHSWLFIELSKTCKTPCPPSETIRLEK